MHRAARAVSAGLLLASGGWLVPSPLPASEAATKGLEPVVVDVADGNSVAFYERSYALLVGVSDYTGGWSDLPSVPGELDAVQAALQTNGFAVERVAEPVDARALKESFEGFIKSHGYDEQTRLLFFFSGHGHTRTVTLGPARQQRGYLVPADAPDPKKDQAGFLAKALPMEQILAWARQMEVRHALFLFDSCFSGSVFEARGGAQPPAHITSRIARPVREFITAGDAGETVPSKSVFAPSFVRALEGEGDLDGDGYVVGTELGNFLHDRVMGYGGGQTPQFGKIRDPDLDAGDFVFRVAATAMPAPPAGHLDISGLTQRARVEHQWRQWRDRMTADFAQIEALGGSEVSPTLEVEAWEKYLAAYAADDPTSEQDQGLRRLAQERLDRARTLAARGDAESQASESDGAVAGTRAPPTTDGAAPAATQQLPRSTTLEALSHLLDQTGLRYQLEGADAIRVLFGFPDDRSQLVFLHPMRDLREIGLVEIYSPVIRLEDGVVSSALAVALLRATGEGKVGYFGIEQVGDRTVVFCYHNLPTPELTPAALEAVLSAVAVAADGMEREQLGAARDDF
jgi:hypothetical protein